MLPTAISTGAVHRTNTVVLTLPRRYQPAGAECYPRPRTEGERGSGIGDGMRHTAGGPPRRVRYCPTTPNKPSCIVSGACTDVPALAPSRHGLTPRVCLRVARKGWHQTTIVRLLAREA